MTSNPTAGGDISGTVLFYSRPEPLAPELHGKLGVKRTDTPFKFAKEGHAIPLTVGEFPVFALTGPIIFVGDDKLPLGVMGLNAGENMFVREDGMFDAGVYIPAYIRRYPFVYANDEQNNQMVLCIDRGADFVVEGGDMPFFENGQPSEYTKSCMEFCNNFEMERQRTESFVQLLRDLDLFELKTATFQPPPAADGTQAPAQKMADYYGVSEDKLGKLSPEKLAELRDNGALAQIYAHLVSLIGWDRLIALALTRNAERQPQAANA